jgi:hypothetical protein
MRTTVVSTSKLKISKTIGILIIVMLFFLMTGTTIMKLLNGQTISGILIIIVWAVILYKAIKLVWSLKNISYDDSSVYYEKAGFEVQIPFEEIRDIEIKTLTGIYTINLHTTSQDGEKISFKTSMWYPLNFKKKDAEVNELRDKIDRYKRTLPEKNFEGLPSYKI